MSDYLSKDIGLINMQKILDLIPEMIEKGLDGVVFYVDGGMRKVLGKNKASFGAHAYFYKDEVAKKGHGAKDYLPTPLRYKEKSKVGDDEKCTIMYYYDAFGPSSGGTNQTGEMDGLLYALNIILESKLYNHVKRIRIYSDSEYVVKGSQEWITGWKSRNWCNSSGQPVSSKERWLDIDEKLTKVKSLTTDFAFQWVRGHVDYGNILADYQASSGLFHPSETRELISLPENYYETDNSSSKLLLDSKLYHLMELNKTVEIKDIEYHQYLTFSHPSQGFDITTDVGKAVRDFGIGIVYLKEADGVLDKTADVCNDILDRLADVPVIVYLQNVLKPTNRDEILDGLASNYNITSEGMVKSLNNDTLFFIANPSRLSYKLKPIYTYIADKLEDYLNGDSDILLTDVTDKFYTKTKKKSKEVLKFTLTSETFIKVPAKFKVGDEVKEDIITITFGLDTPVRRTFNGISEDNPKVGVLTWEESEGLFNYALFVETDEGYGVWCGAFDNTHQMR